MCRECLEFTAMKEVEFQWCCRTTTNIGMTLTISSHTIYIVLFNIDDTVTHIKTDILYVL